MIDKAKLQMLRPIIDAALANIGREHLVIMRLGNGKYDPELGTFSFKLEGKDSLGDPPELLLLRRYASMLDLDLAWLDKDKVLSYGKTYRMCGLKSGRSGYKVIARNTADGKLYLFAPKVFHTEARKQSDRERAELDRADAKAEWNR